MLEVPYVLSLSKLKYQCHELIFEYSCRLTFTQLCLRLRAPGFKVEVGAPLARLQGTVRIVDAQVI